MMMVMSMGERLRLVTTATNVPIVHPQLIYERTEPWWDGITGETPDSSIRALWQSYQSSVAKQEELAKEMMNLALRSICSYFEGNINTP
jgi:hypothetical protein